MDTKEPELNHEAKHAIRGYLLKLTAIPAVAIAVVTFFIGFFINAAMESSKATAYTDAYKQASVHILSLSAAAQEAKSEAVVAKQNSTDLLRSAQDSREQTQKILAEAERVVAKLNTTSAIQQTENVVGAVVESLVNRPDFREDIRRSALPVGAICPFWGSTTELPKDFELCDGQPPSTPGAKLIGNKPNLIGRFARGADLQTEDVRKSGKNGGLDLIPKTRIQTDGTAITIEQMPRHNHQGKTAEAGAHQHEIPLTHLNEGALFGAGAVRQRVPVSSSIADRAVFLTSVTGTHVHQIGAEGDGRPHSHELELPEQTNLPAFQEVLYIIKVR